MGGDQSSYRIKDISFLGSSRRILMQSANGPCPLLAACNVLLLRNQLKLPASSTIGFEDLIQELSNVLLDANASATSTPKSSQDEAKVANLLHGLDNCIEVLPNLNVGLDVNCRFTGPKDFEPTRELCVFDLLDMSVVHGWVVSPEDARTYRVVTPHSYN